MENIENLPYFTLSQIALSYKDRKTASVVVANKLRQKKLHSIREGIYISQAKMLEISLSGKISSFKEFIATNLVYTPSYLSLEYVLFENNIITENVYTFTLVTTKKTASFSNTFGKFIYRSIKEEFFGDYKLITKDGFTIYKASPEKALFDYLYLKKGIVFEGSYMEELRLNLENLNHKAFEKILKKYKSQKVQKIWEMLKKL